MMTGAIKGRKPSLKATTISGNVGNFSLGYPFKIANINATNIIINAIKSPGNIPAIKRAPTDAPEIVP